MPNQMEEENKVRTDADKTKMNGPCGLNGEGWFTINYLTENRTEYDKPTANKPS